MKYIYRYTPIRAENKMLVGIYMSMTYVRICNCKHAYMQVPCCPTFSHSIRTSGYLLNEIVLGLSVITFLGLAYAYILSRR